MVTIPKYKIFEIMNRLSIKFNIKILTYLSWMSVSWYYKHRKLILSKQTKDIREREDVEQIIHIVTQWERKLGYRVVTMKLSEKNIIMNHKKVLRIMKKYNLLSKVRQKDPYNKIRKATQEHSVAKNILNREFRWYTPYTKLWTDITYIKFLWKWIYLSIVKDIISWELLSHQVENNLWLWIVQNTLKKLEKLDLKWALIHSDQWFHYTHPCFKLWIKKLWLIQSMSRRWNCIDNAPTESFFGHMKDEIDITECKNLDDVRKNMDNYIFHYNNTRPQWNKKKMTPVQYRNHLLSLQKTN